VNTMETWVFILNITVGWFADIVVVCWTGPMDCKLVPYYNTELFCSRQSRFVWDCKVCPFPFCNKHTVVKDNSASLILLSSSLLSWFLRGQKQTRNLGENFVVNLNVVCQKRAKKLWPLGRTSWTVTVIFKCILP
jgi:hypothetical protein